MLIIKIFRKIKSVWNLNFECIHIFFHSLRLKIWNKTKQNTTQVVSMNSHLHNFFNNFDVYRISNFWNEKILSTWVMLCVCVYIHVVCMVNILAYLSLLLLLVRLTLMRSILWKMKSFHTQCNIIANTHEARASKLAQKLCKIFSRILWNFR